MFRTYWKAYNKCVLYARAGTDTHSRSNARAHGKAGGNTHAVAEMLNCSVGNVVTLKYGSDIMTVNGKDVKMDTSVIIRDDRTYIPVRFVAETLGLAVEWK